MTTINEDRPSPLLDLPRALMVFVWVSLALTIASFLFSAVARHLGYGLPYSSPYFFVPNNRFSDFYGFFEKYKYFGTPAFFSSENGFFMYPVPMVFVYRAFLYSEKSAKITFVSFMLCTYGALILAFTRILRRAGLRGSLLAVYVTAVVMLSYPLMFNLTRWNIEFLIFALSSLGIWAFWRDRFYTAAIYFGLAASLKFFPFIFLGLLFARKRYKEAAFGVAVGVVVTLVSLKLLGPTIPQALAWDNLQMAAFRQHFAGVPGALGYDHSFFALIKWIMLPWSRDLTTWVSRYTQIGAVAGLLLYFGRIWRMPALNQVLAISILAVTLAPTSYDYTLLSLYPAFLLLSLRALTTARRMADGRPMHVLENLNAHFLLFAIIFTPLSFVVWNNGVYAGQFRLLALTALLVLALVKPLPEVSEQEQTPSFESHRRPALSVDQASGA